jgi:hypothetical protein
MDQWESSLFHSWTVIGSEAQTATNLNQWKTEASKQNVDTNIQLFSFVMPLNI